MLAQVLSQSPQQVSSKLFGVSEEESVRAVQGAAGALCGGTYHC